MKLIVLEPENRKEKRPGILWIHGGGYVTGMASMVVFSCGRLLGEKLDAIVISPEYTLAASKPYPAAFEDCYRTLLYMWQHAEELGIDKDRIVVGGESAGGGLAAAVCIAARDRGTVKVAMQLPLYPMLDCCDTASSKDNHGLVWNTRRNHQSWNRYLSGIGDGEIPPYASPSRESDYAGLPCCYTYVCDGEPFYQETLDYVMNLKRANVKADVDIYRGNIHSFDILLPWTRQAKAAKEKLCLVCRQYLETL